MSTNIVTKHRPLQQIMADITRASGNARRQSTRAETAVGGATVVRAEMWAQSEEDYRRELRHAIQNLSKSLRIANEYGMGGRKMSALLRRLTEGEA